LKSPSSRVGEASRAHLKGSLASQTSTSRKGTRSHNPIVALTTPIKWIGRAISTLPINLSENYVEVISKFFTGLFFITAGRLCSFRNDHVFFRFSNQSLFHKTLRGLSHTGNKLAVVAPGNICAPWTFTGTELVN
jgi:hypothetical protein